ncbi:MAG: hypothetical protein BEN18_00570 [Epulopiscium sp. Nuni2H_MBin001]|nr:MAG: hypothetical protein BEN18_00570 [Epulopiscium sp. Nuni2H_MBin001]
MVINNNLMADNANRFFAINSTNQASSMEKLSSGMRINRAGDDAAGLAISEKMRNQINGLDQASRNAQDGVSLIQTAEGALAETHEMLQRMRELSIQSMNDTYTDSDREKIDLEVQQLLQEIDGVADKTEFNEQKLLAGDGSVAFSTGASGVSNAYTDGYSRTELKTMIAEAEAEIYADLDAEIAIANPTFGGFGTSSFEDIKSALQDMASNPESYIADDGTPYYELSLEDQLKLYADINPNTNINVSAYYMDSATAGTTVLEAEMNGYGSTFSLTDLEDSIADLGEMKAAYYSMAAEFDDSISGSKTFEFHVGANQNQKVSVEIQAMGVMSLGLDEVDMSTKAGASASLAAIDIAIESVSEQRAILGAAQIRLEHTVKNVDNTAENLQSAESQIRDTDMADEMVTLTKYNILAQASQSMLAQANQVPQQVLQLL